MSKIIVLAFLLLPIASFSQKVDKRTKYFPKEVVPLKKLPSRENFWIFVLAGQSNMAGRGHVEPQDTIPNKRILTIDKDGEWIEAKEPLHFYEPKMKGLDCGMSFARTLLESVPDSVTIGLIPCAIGGSSIEQWIGDSLFRHVQLLSNFESKVNWAKQDGVIKGILWHQGESDAHPPMISSYEANLRTLIGKFRKIVGNDAIPVFIGELGRYAEPAERHAHWAGINQQKKKYVATDKNSYLISSEGLNEKGDNTHFNSASQRELGKRFAEKFLETQ